MCGYLFGRKGAIPQFASVLLDDVKWLFVFCSGVTLTAADEGTGTRAVDEQICTVCKQAVLSAASKKLCLDLQ
jgi:hypothetical protein